MSLRSSLSPCIPGLPAKVVAVPEIIAIEKAPSRGNAAVVATVAVPLA
jgi:hypothetical protein